MIQLKSEKGKSLSKLEAYEVIREYLKEQIDLAVREMISKESFNQAAWSEYQALQIGNIRALNKLLAFIPDPEKSID